MTNLIQVEKIPNEKNVVPKTLNRIAFLLIIIKKKKKTGFDGIQAPGLRYGYPMSYHLGYHQPTNASRVKSRYFCVREKISETVPW